MPTNLRKTLGVGQKQKVVKQNKAPTLVAVAVAGLGKKPGCGQGCSETTKCIKTNAATQTAIIDLMANSPQFCTATVSCVKAWLAESGVAPEVASELCAYLGGLASAGTLTLGTKVVLGSCNYGTVGQILALVTNSLSSTGNTITSTVNGNVSTANIVNTNVLSSVGLNITSTVNGVADSENITSAVQALIDSNTDSFTGQLIGHTIATHVAVDNTSFAIKETVVAPQASTRVGNVVTLPLSVEDGTVPTWTFNVAPVKHQEFVNLVANTPLTITHNLNLTNPYAFQKTFLTSLGDDINLKITNILANSFDITSNANETNVSISVM